MAVNFIEKYQNLVISSNWEKITIKLEKSCLTDSLNICDQKLIKMDGWVGVKAVAR